VEAANNHSNHKPGPASLLGVGFDAKDGQVRLTRGHNYALVGGSERTHAVMQETAVKINEHADRTGKRLEDVTHEELRDICLNVHESYGEPE
jgi:hypothetical protein